MSDNNSAYQSAIKRSQLTFTNFNENNIYDDQQRMNQKSHLNLNRLQEPFKSENKENYNKDQKRYNIIFSNSFSRPVLSYKNMLDTFLEYY